MTDKRPNKHIKMYCTDNWLERVKEQAKEEGMTQSAYVFSIVKAKLNRIKK